MCVFSRIALFGLLAIILTLVCMSAVAQTPSGNCVGVWHGYNCTTDPNDPCDLPPPGAWGCFAGGNFDLYCYVWTNECAPVNGASECAPGKRCLACERAAAAGHPINLANGNVFIDQTDLAVPGLGGGLALARVWNSILPDSQSAFNTGIFGSHWRSNYEERIFVGSDNFIKYMRGDGSFWSFGR